MRYGGRKTHKTDRFKYRDKWTQLDTVDRTKIDESIFLDLPTLLTSYFLHAIEHRKAKPAALPLFRCLEGLQWSTRLATHTHTHPSRHFHTQTRAKTSKAD